MARSHSIYVVEEFVPRYATDRYAVKASFTVKHELITWLQKRRERTPLSPPLRITRLRDGQGNTDAKIIPEQELLN